MWARPNVHALSLIRCPKVIDLSLFSNLNTLTLFGCNASSLSSLSNLHTVSLSSCPGVEDLSPLARVHTLTVFFCVNVSNVSPVSSVHTLILSLCPVSDVSMLSNTNLTIIGMRTLVDCKKLLADVKRSHSYTIARTSHRGCDAVLMVYDGQRLTVDWNLFNRSNGTNFFPSAEQFWSLPFV